MNKSPGQVAFEAYVAFSNGKSLVSGDDIPGWDALSGIIQQAWEAAAFAVMTEVNV